MVHSMTHHLKGQRSSAVFGAVTMKEPNLVFETDKITVFQQQLGEWDNLNHLLVCKSSNKACIIDPFDGHYWFNFCQSQGFLLTDIWLTHSHWDHIKGVEELIQLISHEVIVRCHYLEQERGYQREGTMWWRHREFTEIIQQFGMLNFAIYCTPGHTPGHVVIIGNGVVVAGDCLFLESCGRTDLFGGDRDKQRKSLFYLRQILLELDGLCVVLPGHRYELSDGSNPMNLTLTEVMSINQALRAIDSDDDWNNLPFLSFDDDLAERAKRQRALNS